MRWRSLSMGLSTVLGLKRQGFFIPYRYAEGVAENARAGRYSAYASYFDAAKSTFEGYLMALEGYGEALKAIDGGPPPAARFDQDWFPTLDAAIAYVLVRQRRPGRIVEVGSGHSSRFFARAVADEGLDTRIVAIDPAPRANLDGLGLELVRGTLATVGLAPFADVAAGDVVSIDSSHILVPGSDVDDFLNRILPSLPAGVLVQIHDIFLPDAYPEAWAWRGYNEQNAIGPLLAGGGWSLLFASHYVATRMAEQVAAGVIAGLPRAAGAYDSSLWLEKS